jgi:hypothetical protein
LFPKEATLGEEAEQGAESEVISRRVEETYIASEKKAFSVDNIYVCVCVCLYVYVCVGRYSLSKYNIDR